MIEIGVGFFSARQIDMPTRPIPHEVLQESLNAVAQYGGEFAAAAALGIPRSTLQHRVVKAKVAGLEPNYIAPSKAGTGKGKRVLVIPDMHCPFHHPDTLEFLMAAKGKFSPDRVICLGDETDQHVLGRWEPDPSGFSAMHEHLKALDALKPIYELFPVVGVCDSNHGERIFKRAYRAGIPQEFIKDYREFMDSPAGWSWAHKFEIDDVIYEHGEGVSGQLGAMKRAMSNGYRSTVIGHLHADAGILWQSSGDKIIFAMNAGCLIDVTAYAFAYGKHSARKPMIGVGIVDKGIPSFVPMQVDVKNRWTGNI